MGNIFRAVDPETGLIFYLDYDGKLQVIDPSADHQTIYDGSLSTLVREYLVG